MKKILLSTIALLIAANLSASNDLYNKFYNIFDSTLHKSGLKKHDIWLAGDFSDVSYNKLKHIDDFFNYPISSIALSRNIDESLQNFKINNSKGFTDKVSKYLEIKDIQRINLTSPVSERELKNFFDVKFDDDINIVTSMIFRQYLTIFYNALNLMSQNPVYSDINKYKFVTQYYDSVLFSIRKKMSPNFFENVRYDIEFEKNIEKFAENSEIFTSSNIPSISFSLFEALLEQNEKLKDIPKELMETFKSTEINTKYGKIAIGLRESNQYNGDYLFILDLGGNDVYLLSEREKSNVLNRPISIIMDIGGDDIYKAGSYSLGGTAFGISLMLDYKGNDQYIAKDASLGCGIFGVGLLIDLEGDDSYQGGLYTQGAASFGIGLLIDESGTDKYYSEAYSQGFASIRAFAALLDKAGNDIYISSSRITDATRYEDRYISFSQGATLGIRPYSGSGYGFLIDNSGNDLYKSEIFGQGVSYWHGLGALIDKGGNDKYCSHQYAQGSGVHFGFGILADYSGDDNYQSFSVSQGCGHDVAFGALIDFDGNDKYTTDNLSLGGGNANAISLFMDINGNDQYSYRDESNSLAYSDFRRYFGSPAFFIDAAGQDIYSNIDKNNTSTNKSSFAFFYDYDNSIANQNDSPKEQVKAQGRTIEELFMEASNSLLAIQKYRKPAIDELIARGKETLDFVKTKMNSKYPREIYACEEIVRGIALNNKQLGIDFLREGINSEISKVSRLSMRIAALAKLSELNNDIYNKANSQEYKVRETVAEVIGSLYDKSSNEVLYNLASDKHKIVRAKAAYSLGKNISSIDFEKFKPLLADEYYLVAYNAIKGLSNANETTLDLMINLFTMELPGDIYFEMFSKYENRKLKKNEVKSLKATLKAFSIEEKQSLYSKLKEQKQVNIEHLINEIIKIEKDKKLKSILKNKEVK